MKTVKVIQANGHDIIVAFGKDTLTFTQEPKEVSDEIAAYMQENFGRLVEIGGEADAEQTTSEEAEVASEAPEVTPENAEVAPEVAEVSETVEAPEVAEVTTEDVAPVDEAPETPVEEEVAETAPVTE